MLMKYLTLLWTHLSWVLNFLLYYPFYKLHDSKVPIIEEEVSICDYYESTTTSEEGIDCAVCLCKIEEMDEIRVLRCDHLFHRDCLDKWVGFKNAICPLCREPMGPRRVITELGAEVLFFQFCAIHNDDEHDTWWLR
ncbi:hypothetical protein TanjilG_07773 [Lupinus angustifolius]|uniref:RING-type domain-containing protein n=1 Tax=Lupinus angustifolius TaxID=3871 RepID=A0A1J7GVZ2_LUPAN|nr:PREDICTED: E3 ubiquitin-protein ligase RHA2B-like [Lupinus angustifolius]OIW04638.1 hypothetical protein TanjilG_07773 [Lupinus angustifolius]